MFTYCLDFTWFTTWHALITKKLFGFGRKDKLPDHKITTKEKRNAEECVPKINVHLRFIFTYT